MGLGPRAWGRAMFCSLDDPACRTGICCRKVQAADCGSASGHGLMLSPPCDPDPGPGSAHLSHCGMLPPLLSPPTSPSLLPGQLCLQVSQLVSIDALPTCSVWHPSGGCGMDSSSAPAGGPSLAAVVVTGSSRWKEPLLWGLLMCAWGQQDWPHVP